MTEKLNREDAGEEKKKCPRCGKPMEEFAAAWGWAQCFDCSVELREKELGRRGKDAGNELHREQPGIPGVVGCPDGKRSGLGGVSE